MYHDTINAVSEKIHMIIAYKQYSEFNHQDYFKQKEAEVDKKNANYFSPIVKMINTQSKLLSS